MQLSADSTRAAMKSGALTPPDRAMDGIHLAALQNPGALPVSRSAQVELMATRERYNALFEQVSDGVFIIDSADGRCSTVNKAFCDALGYPPEELFGKRMRELLCDQHAPAFSALLQQLIRTRTARGEFTLRRHDGSPFPADLALTLLSDGNWQVLVRGSPHHGRTEEVLRFSEAKFAGIYSVSADAIISVDEGQRIVMFNDSATKVFGYSAEEIIGLPLEILIPDRFRDVHRQHMAGFTAGEQRARQMGSRSTRIFGLRKNGEEFPTDAAISKLELGGKKLLTVSLRDISEQQRSEDEQRLLAEIGEILVQAGCDYQRLLNDVARNISGTVASWCAIDILQAGGARRVKIVHSDPDKAALCEALEREPVDWHRPNPIAEAFNARRSILIEDPDSNFFQSLAQNEAHLQLLLAFDPRSLIVVPLFARDQPLGTLAFGAPRSRRRYDARDVRLAEQLAHRLALAVEHARLHEALERALKARDDVLGIVAHDLRSPLNVIVLGARALRRSGGEPERRDQTTLASIQRSAMSMHRLIEDLLDVARLEAGQSLSIQPTRVSTLGILGEAIECRRATSLALRRELRLDAAGAPPTVRADRTRLLQVFDNLLGNAMKFSRESITVGSSASNGEALFWVADDGPGIREDDLPRIFDRFWQASKADTEGAGLGLSIVQGIIHAHGGRVWVESKLGEGTTFFFTLPLEPPG